MFFVRIFTMFLKSIELPPWPGHKYESHDRTEQRPSLVCVGGELRAADHLDCDGLEGHLELLGVLAGAVVQHVVHQVDEVQLGGEGRALLGHPVCGRRIGNNGIRMIRESETI